MDNIVVHVEVRMSASSTRVDTIFKHVHEHISSCFHELTCPGVLTGWDENHVLASSVERIATSELSRSSIAEYPFITVNPYESTVFIPIERCELDIHVYQASEDDTYEECISAEDNTESDVSAATVCTLPVRTWEGLWDSLIYADDIKMGLLNYIHATILLSDAQVDCTSASHRYHAHISHFHWASDALHS
jgi:pachytene checkpoint protein 2